ncbi:MAG: YbdD/YjiX family protein [Sporichthyaceae bacterium]|nr:YbdD/YjiX family protein [Sporichthyaceae bacterium]
MRTAVLAAGRGIRWYLKQATGEAKWDEYLDGCRSEDREPMSRRDFERHRSEHRENNPQSRCC